MDILYQATAFVLNPNSRSTDSRVSWLDIHVDGHTLLMLIHPSGNSSVKPPFPQVLSLPEEHNKHHTTGASSVR